MLDLNQYYDDHQKLLDEAYYTNQALIRFMYDHEEGCSWIVGHKDKVGELSDKFNEVVLALKGEFTRAYAGSLGSKLIYNHLYLTSERISVHYSVLCDGLKNALDSLINAKFSSLERETNTVIYDLILNKVKNSKIYVDYINETLKANHKVICKYIQNSADPAKDLTLLPYVLVNILNETMAYYNKANEAILKHQKHYNFMLKNLEVDGLESDKLLDDLPSYTKIDIKNKILQNTEIESIISDKLKQYPVNDGKGNYTMLDGVENLLNRFSTTIKDSLQKTIEDLNSTPHAINNSSANCLNWSELQKNLTKSYEENKITNEEYEKCYEHYNKWFNYINNLEKQYFFILLNTKIIISELINLSIESYNSLSKSFKFME